MPILRCYVDERTLAILTEYGQRNGRTVEELAESAISDAAIRSLPPPRQSTFEKAEDAFNARNYNSSL